MEIKLLQALPDYPVGTIFKVNSDGYDSYIEKNSFVLTFMNCHMHLSVDDIKQYPTWFSLQENKEE